MSTPGQSFKVELNPAEFANLVVGAALGDGLPADRSIDFSARRCKPMVVVAAAPKSGSTFLSNVLSRITALPYCRLSAAYSTNEHDLYLPALYMMNRSGCVSQLHMKGTFHNASLLKMFGIKPVILVRHIEDTIVSLVNDLRTKEQLAGFGTGQNGYSFLWQDQAIASLGDAALIDCIIDLVIPWYVNFYVSWHRLCEQGAVDALWINYEDMMQAKQKVVIDILNFTGFDPAPVFDHTVLNTRYTKFNDSRSGRGTELLSEEQKSRLRKLFGYYPNISFARYGL